MSFGRKFIQSKLRVIKKFSPQRRRDAEVLEKQDESLDQNCKTDNNDG